MLTVSFFLPSYILRIRSACKYSVIKLRKFIGIIGRVCHESNPVLEHRVSGDFGATLCDHRYYLDFHLLKLKVCNYLPNTPDIKQFKQLM